MKSKTNSPIANKEAVDSVFEEYDEQFMYFLAIALLFFVVEMLVGDRRSKRHLFNR